MTTTLPSDRLALAS